MTAQVSNDKPDALAMFIDYATSVRADGNKTVGAVLCRYAEAWRAERAARSTPLPELTHIIPDVDWLANVIRTNSGDHLNPPGAGVLAEKIVEAMRGTMKGTVSTTLALSPEPKVFPHRPAAFINAIAEEGTKEEAIEYLQKEWNENYWLREELRRVQSAITDSNSSSTTVQVKEG